MLLLRQNVVTRRQKACSHVKIDSLTHSTYHYFLCTYLHTYTCQLSVLCFLGLGMSLYSWVAGPYSREKQWQTHTDSHYVREML